MSGNGCDRGVVALLPRLLEAGADGLQAEDLEALLLGFAVLLELAQQGPPAELLQITGLVRVEDVPAVVALGLKRQVVLGQVAQILEIRGKVAVKSGTSAIYLH